MAYAEIFQIITRRCFSDLRKFQLGAILTVIVLAIEAAAISGSGTFQPQAVSAFACFLWWGNPCVALVLAAGQIYLNQASVSRLVRVAVRWRWPQPPWCLATFPCTPSLKFPSENISFEPILNRCKNYSLYLVRIVLVAHNFYSRLRRLGLLLLRV